MSNQSSSNSTANVVHSPKSKNGSPVDFQVCSDPDELIPFIGIPHSNYGADYFRGICPPLQLTEENIRTFYSGEYSVKSAQKEVTNLLLTHFTVVAQRDQEFFWQREETWSIKWIGSSNPFPPTIVQVQHIMNHRMVNKIPATALLAEFKSRFMFQAIGTAEMKPPFSQVDIEALTRKMRKDKSLNLKKLNARLGPDVFQQIYRPLAATGLLPFLTQLPVKNIPDYVVEFYYNATINGDNFISTVKNQVIIVTKDTMMSTLHLSGSGPDVMNLNLPSKHDHIVHDNFEIIHLSEIKAHITAALYFGCQADWASYILAQLRANVERATFDPSTGTFREKNESTMFHLIHTRGSTFWISEGTWSRHWMNHPLSSPPTLSEIMDSMIKRLQLGISADAPLLDNEPANSSCTPFVGDPPLPSSDEIFTSLGPISVREQDIFDPGQFMSTEDAYAWLSPSMQIPSVPTAHNDNLETAFTSLPNQSLSSCDPLHLLDYAKKGEDGQNDDEQYNGCMTLWDQIQRELIIEGKDQLQGEAWTLQGVQKEEESSRRKKSN
ncbi:hypothetical protein C2S51_020570 [Perilla frutescens var. frutescens]|nr:hypothetical protein C2S51_020570 [Perilla frutescens var. frutescens]